MSVVEIAAPFLKSVDVGTPFIRVHFFKHEEKACTGG